MVNREAMKERSGQHSQRYDCLFIRVEGRKINSNQASHPAL